MIWDKVFFIALTVVGLGIGAYIIYSGWESVENPPVSRYTGKLLTFIFGKYTLTPNSTV